MSDKNDKTLSEILFAFNNRIVAIKDIIKKAKIFQCTKIVRQIKLLSKKKGNEIQIEKNKRKCEHLKEEINYIKKQKFNEIAIFAFDNDQTSFEQFIKTNNKNITLDKISLARVAFSKPVQKAIEDIKIDPKIPNWKQIFIKYKARCEKRKNWKEKNRLLKEIETKLKPENDDNENQPDIPENVIENDTNEKILEKKEEKKVIEKNDGLKKNESLLVDTTEDYDSHDDDKWNEESSEDKSSDENSLEEDSPEEEDSASIDLDKKFVFSKSDLPKVEKEEKKLKPLVIGEKPSHMVIKQINLDEVKDCDELQLGENSEKFEKVSHETLKAVEDPFFLDLNGNEIQGNDSFKYAKKNFDYDFNHDPVSYSSYDKYKRKKDDFRDKRREMGRNSFKNSLSSESRNFRSYDRPSNFKSQDRNQYDKRKFEFKQSFDNKPKEDLSKLHPSWQAKKLAEEKAKSLKFEGKKIKFTDDE